MYKQVKNENTKMQDWTDTTSHAQT